MIALGQVAAMATVVVSAAWLVFVLRELFERRPTSDPAEMRTGQYLASVFHTLWVWGLDDSLEAEAVKASPIIVRRARRLLAAGLVPLALALASRVLIGWGAP